MRTTNSSLGLITYPDEICFAFNPTYVKITECTANEVTLRISAISGTYYLNYMAYNGIVVANLSHVLQMLFDTYNIVETRAINAYIEIANGVDTVHSFNSAVIWGSIIPGETFNGSRRVRWFDNWPQKLSVFDGGNFQDVTIINESYYTVNPWDYTFDYTFCPVSQESITFVHDTSRDGVFLRWIDRHGRLQYWLFHRGTMKFKNVSGGNELTMDYTDREGNSFRSIKRQQYFFGEVSLALCAPSVDKEDCWMLSSILTSPVIDLYHPDRMVGWEPVRIAKSTSKITTDILQDFDFEINLPNINAQSL